MAIRVYFSDNPDYAGLSRNLQAIALFQDHGRVQRLVVTLGDRSTFVAESVHQDGQNLVFECADGEIICCYRGNVAQIMCVLN